LRDKTGLAGTSNHKGGFMAQWHFTPQYRDDVDDETTVSKNFARESRLLAGVFVREFFQNVLDARTTDANGNLVAPHVRIRFLDPSSLAASDLAKLLTGLHDHLTAAGHDVSLWDASRANALVLEELHTSGLVGATDNSRAKGLDERWANFWFGEGKRTKRGNSLGRAGQGKITYHLISGTQTVIALTNQHGGQSDLLFGKCIVQRTHEVGGKHYKRHGYWPRVDTHHQPLPSDSVADIADIKSTFQLTRSTETGTSWIIPYVQVDAFNKKSLIEEILRDFFFSIMAGELTVDVMGETMNQSNISEMIGKYPIDDLPPEFVGFLEEAVTLPDTDPKFITVKDDWYGTGTETAMLDTAIDETNLEKAREVLDDNGLVAVKLPIQISPLGQPKSQRSPPRLASFWQSPTI
jgi:hypothetical protein